MAAVRTDDPLVSVVVPVLNGERYIERCLRSIRELTGDTGSVEIIVMDNGSTDRTHAIIRELGCGFQVVPGVRVGGLRNRGIQRARGAYVAFVDSDVELEPAWLQGAMTVFDDASVVAAGCFPAVPKGATWVQRAWDLHQRGRWRHSGPSPARWLSSMNLLARRADLLAIGGFNERLETAEDVDLCYRLASRGRLVWNPAMSAVHWGEAPNLRTFWRKEVWRGKGNLQGTLSHGIRWDELPSIGYPLYMALFGGLTVASAGVDLLQGRLWWWPLTTTLLVLPALLLTVQTACMSASFRAMPQLFLLYALYGWARAYALVRA